MAGEKIVLVNLGQKFASQDIRDAYYHNITSYLRANGLQVKIEDGDEYDEELTVALLQEAEGVIFSSNGPMSRTVIEQLPKLKLIFRYGIGLNSIDLDAATESGKVVCYTPGFCSEEIGIHAVALGLAALRNIAWYDSMTRRGVWLKGNGPLPRRPGNLTIGLFGLGGSGRVVAKAMGRGFGSTVIAHDPHVANDVAEELNVRLVAFGELLRQSDMIFITAPLLPETRHIFNADAFASMKDGAILVNISRGGLVDTEALLAALRSGKVAKAALDVFEKEPLDPDNELLHNDTVTVTPHSAYYGKESLERADFLVSRIPVHFFRDKTIYRKNLANPAVMDMVSGYTVVDQLAES